MFFTIKWHHDKAKKDAEEKRCKQERSGESGE